jgi:hypothetical protein
MNVWRFVVALAVLGWHYPSDTLVSIAIGNFCGIFFNDVFPGLDTNRAMVAFAPCSESSSVRTQG